MRGTPVRAGLLLVGLVLAAPLVRAQGGAGTLIVGDASGSMKGYVAKSGANRLAALYQLLYRNASSPTLSALTSDPKTGEARIAAVSQASHFAAPSSYRGETDLVFGLQHLQRHGALGVFVTDGMQSGGTYLRVKEELLKMVREGWGVWLISVKLPFDGVYDPEQLLDLNALRPAIERCAQQDDPHAVISHKPGSNRFYNYAGARPLLLFVFAKDAAAGRELTQRLDSNLRADPQYSAQVAELAPLFYRGVAFTPAQEVSDYVRLEESADEVVIRSDTVDGQRIKEVGVPVAWKAGEPPIKQPLVEAPMFAPIELVSWVDDPPQVVDERDPGGTQLGRFKVLFVSELPWYRRTFCFLPFVACEEAKSDALNLTIWTEFQEDASPWWAALNTDNSYECPSRVYKLTELARDLAQAARERLKPEERKASKSLKLIVGRV